MHMQNIISGGPWQTTHTDKDNHCCQKSGWSLLACCCGLMHRHCWLWQTICSMTSGAPQQTTASLAVGWVGYHWTTLDVRLLMMITCNVPLPHCPAATRKRPRHDVILSSARCHISCCSGRGYTGQLCAQHANMHRALTFKWTTKGGDMQSPLLGW